MNLTKQWITLSAFIRYERLVNAALDYRQPISVPNTFTESTHRLIAQVLDSAVEVGCLPQQSSHVLRSNLVKIRTRPRAGEFECISRGLLLGRARCNRQMSRTILKETQDEIYIKNWICIILHLPDLLHDTHSLLQGNSGGFYHTPWVRVDRNHINTGPSPDRMVYR
jgi:hypothetical protein